EEVEAWKAKCPIRRLRRELLDRGVAEEEELGRLEEEVEREVREAIECALKSPYAGPEELYELVY
ncbi:pyruvate dehydrogenase (acetyl-transferring) E1 component subunit alpha, partial [Candidatus Bathyarchaeota archaeon]